MTKIVMGDYENKKIKFQEKVFGKIIIGVVVGLIVTGLGYYFFGREGVNVEGNDIIAANEITNSELLKNTDVEGDLVLGDKVVNENQKVNSQENNKEQDVKIFKGSVFDILKRIEAGNTSLDKIEIAEKYYGLKIAETGVIVDLFGGTYIYAEIKKADSISENNTRIFCEFDDEWKNTLRSIDVPVEVMFEATIDQYYNSPPEGIMTLRLKDCALNF